MRRTALLLVAASAAAQQTTAPPSEEKPPIEIGFEQRVRNENWNNILDWSDQTNDQRNQIRYRTRLWTRIPVTTNIEFAVGINQETNQIIGADNHFDEFAFETAYVHINHFFSKRLSLRVGRQNLMKGEGFILLEGNPWDGSRTIYHNAAVLTYNSKNSTLDFIGIYDPAYDRFLPRFHDQHRLLEEWTESALGTYYIRNLNKKTALEAYYIYKREFRDTRGIAAPQYQPDRHVQTTGARLIRQLPRGFSSTSEFAVQRGAQQTNIPIAAWGGYSYVKKSFAAPAKSYIQAGYWGMSGDDPATPGRIEGWDPIFSRWPKWSELYIYSQFREKGVAYWTNTSMWQAEYGIAPTKKMDLRLTYYRMDAFHPFGRTPAAFGNGTMRGNMLQARMGFSLSRDLSGHVLWENLWPGDFYTGKDMGYFLRFELIYQHRWRLPAQWLAAR
ncbi:MAG: hypothetical protein HY821_19055 [Acidobacteria bacterium]|nr:hypothetical protein [Acidobacteriota bacterium]